MLVNLRVPVMSTEERLKRLGLDKLKDDPEALEKEIQKRLKKRKQEEEEWEIEREKYKEKSKEKKD